MGPGIRLQPRWWRIDIRGRRHVNRQHVAGRERCGIERRREGLDSDGTLQSPSGEGDEKFSGCYACQCLECEGGASHGYIEIGATHSWCKGGGRCDGYLRVDLTACHSRHRRNL